MAHSTKSGSKPERTALRQRLLDDGGTMHEVAAEMRRRWGFRPREAYRHAYGWSQDEVAARFTGIAGRLGSSDRPAGATPGPAMVGTRIGEYERWPLGGRRPSPYVLTVLAEVYGTTLDALLDAADLTAIPEQDRAVLAALSSGQPPADPPRWRPTPWTRPAPPVLLPPAHSTELVRHAEPAPQVEVLLPAEELTYPDRPPRTEPPVAVVPARLAEEALAQARDARRTASLERPELSCDAADLMAVSAAELLAVSAAEAAEFTEWAEVTRVGPSTLEQLDQDVRILARDYLTQPPLPLLRRVLRLRNRVFGLLERRQRPAQARELYLLAGRLCTLAAWIGSDLGFAAEAGTHARTGWLCADLADSGALRGWVRLVQSKLAYWDGRPRESAELAEDGLRHRVRDSGRPMLAALAARSWARAGDPPTARRALRLAEAERAALDTPDQVGGAFGCSEAQQQYLAATTHLWLREPRRALQAADRAVWLFELTPPRERFYAAQTLAQLESAIAQVMLGELDGAATRLAPLLELPPDRRMHVIARRVEDLRQMLRRTPEPASATAARLADELADFRRAG